MTILPGAEPFYFRGGPVGVLLLHGFTAATREVLPVGQVLAAAGYTVLGPRLAHHGTAPEDMFRSHWLDWVNSALDGYCLLSGHCRTIVAGGLSMGGVLSLYLAAEHPMAAVFTMSSPMQPMLDSMDWRARYAGLLGYVVPYAAKGPPSPGSDPDHVAYDRYPVRAVAQLRALLAATSAVLPRVTAPALVVHSRGDSGVPAANLDYIYEHLGSREKERLWLERSGHIVTEGPERALLFEQLLRFVRAHAPLPQAAVPATGPSAA
jgi:carboxylesterase